MPPKRKAASKLSKLIEDEVEDDELTDPQVDAPEDPDTVPPPTKRPRGGQNAAPTATTVSATTTAKRTTRKRRSPVAKPKKQPPKRTAKPTRGAAEQETEEHEELDGEGLEEYGEAVEDQTVSEDELDSPKTVAKPSKGQTRSRRRGQEETETASHLLMDGEFEYTPAGSRKGRRPPKTRGGGRKTGRQPQPPPEPEEDDVSVAEVNETAAEIEETVLDQVQSSPLKGASEKSPYRRTTTQGNRRKSVRIEEPGESEATLRRKLGDTTKKLENAEARYRNLREVGIVEANSNMDKLRKQCEVTTAGNYYNYMSFMLEYQTNSFACSIQGARRIPQKGAGNAG